MMLSIGFITGVIEDKIQNIIANKSLNKDTKDAIKDELNGIKDHFNSKSSDKRYNVKVYVETVDGTSVQYLSTYNVKAIQNKNGYLGLMVDNDKETIKYYKESSIRSIEIWDYYKDQEENQND